MRPVRVRAIESLGQPAAQVSGAARVALNLRGVAREVPARGMALVQAGRWTLARAVDVRCTWPGTSPAGGGQPSAAPRLPRELIVHVGSARTPARVRLLGEAPVAGEAAVPERPSGRRGCRARRGCRVRRDGGGRRGERGTRDQRGRRKRRDWADGAVRAADVP